MESNISRDHIALEAMKCMMLDSKAQENFMEQSCNIVFPIRRRKCYKLQS